MYFEDACNRSKTRTVEKVGHPDDLLSCFSDGQRHEAFRGREPR